MDNKNEAVIPVVTYKYKNNLKKFKLLRERMEKYLEAYDKKESLKKVAIIPTYQILSKKGQDDYNHILGTTPELLHINNLLVMDALVMGIDVKKLVDEYHIVLQLAIADIGETHLYTETDCVLTPLYLLYLLSASTHL